LITVLLNLFLILLSKLFFILLITFIFHIAEKVREKYARYDVETQELHGERAIADIEDILKLYRE
jgi:hypothetical protein